MSAYELALDDDTLAEVAEMRAHSKGWAEFGGDLGWAVRDLRRAVRHSPNFGRAYERAIREVREETEAEALAVLRLRMRDSDADRALRAAKIAAAHRDAERRDRTRLEVEELRVGAARVKLDAKRADDAPADETLAGVPLSGEQFERERALEAGWAAEAAAAGVTVWLWGGRHKIPDTPPGTGDVPLQLVRDTHAGAGRPVYWAFKLPMITDMVAGPFPPVKPVNLPDPLPYPPELAAPADDAPAG